MMVFYLKSTLFKTVKAFLSRQYSSSKVDKIYQYLLSSLNNYEDVNFMPLRVTRFIAERSFSKAPLDIVQYLRDKEGNLRDPRTTELLEVEKGIVGTPLISFRSLFYNGFEALNRKVEKRPIEHPLLSFATETFTAGFLYDREFHESCLQSVLKKGQNEGHINVVMTKHLFSRLAANFGRSYYISNEYLNNRYNLDRCPCARHCGEEIIYDSTGIGSEYLWYGRPDIMLLPYGGICGIVILADSGFEDEEELFEELEEPNVENLIQIVENKSFSLRTKDNVQQIVAMAITISMCQKMTQMRTNPGYPPKVTLIPVIAANANHFDIYLYDSKYDILLRNVGQPIPLWDKVEKKSSILNQSSVLKLWMTINHMSIQPSLNYMDVEILSGSAGITSHFSRDELEEIEDSLRMTRYFEPIKPQEFQFTSSKFSSMGRTVRFPVIADTIWYDNLTVLLHGVLTIK